MTSDYKSFGCFIDNSNNIFPTNITNITGKSYSIEECAQQAINNKSMAFGITGKYPTISENIIIKINGYSPSL